MRPSAVIFIVATILSFLAFNVWEYLPEDWYVYDKLLSLSIVGWLWSFQISMHKRWEFSCTIWVVMWWAVMNAVDELFGDPLEKTFQEYTIALFGAITGWLRYKRIDLQNLIQRLKR